MWPLAGPVAGGTEVEIHGHDLGTEFADISNSVVVADYQCHPDQNKYQPSKRLVLVNVTHTHICTRYNIVLFCSS